MSVEKKTIYIDLKKIGYDPDSFFTAVATGRREEYGYSKTRNAQICAVIHHLGAVGITDYELDEVGVDEWMGLKVSEADATAILMRFDPPAAADVALFEDYQEKHAAYFDALRSLPITINTADADDTRLSRVETVLADMMAEIEADLADRPPSRLRRILGWVKGWFR